MSKIESIMHGLANLLTSTAFLKELALFALCVCGACFLLFNVKRWRVLAVVAAVPLLLMSAYFAFSTSRALDWHLKCPGGYGKNFFNSAFMPGDAPIGDPPVDPSTLTYPSIGGNLLPYTYCDSVEEGQARKALKEARNAPVSEEDSQQAQQQQQEQRARQQQQQQEEAKHMRANRDAYLQALRQTTAAAAGPPQAAPALAEPASSNGARAAR
ncbi:MAG: hypothetical protein LBP52_09180 [Burkholderiaceae bacterium]|jgi:hypothetical protein|nr:hypothetical protein [Burkholderiaceae bacterium]